MARPMKPLVKGGGYYPSNRWTPLVYRGGYTTANGGGEQPDPVEKTASGAIVHITDALASPVSALSVAIEPVQDLRGYDSPWPAGGGKNLVDYLSCIGVGLRNGTDNVYGENASVSGNVLTIIQSYVENGGILKGIQHPSIEAGTSFTLSFEAKCSGTSIMYGYGVYTGGGTSQVESLSITADVWTSVNKTFIAQGGDIGLFLQPYALGTSLEVRNLQLEIGSATAYAPYSNICPISGWTGANVMRTGKNLFSSEVAHGLWTTTTFYSHEGASSKYLTSLNKIPLVGGRSYVVSFENDPNNAVASGSFVAYRGETAVNEATWFNIANGIINVPSGADSIAINLVLTNNIAHISEVTTKNYQLELGSTATAYEPYNADTYSITFPTAAGTVYGGTLDVTTGVLTVDRAIYYFGAGVVGPVNGSEDARSQGLFSAYGFTPTVARVSDISVVTAPDGIICNQFVAAPNNAFLSPGRSPAEASFSQYATSFYVQWSALAGKTNAEAKTLLTGVQISAPLATPIEYDLTPTEVSTLLGTNNVWSDSNGDLTLTYLADGNASEIEALNILLGNRYYNNHESDEPTDREALDIVFGGKK